MLENFWSQQPSGLNPLVRDMLQIWLAGVQAVTPDALVRNKIRQDGKWLVIDDQIEINLSATDRLIVVGAGKASAGLASELHKQIFQHWKPSHKTPKVIGWINAPQGTFTGTLPGIHLHAARPAGVNLPTIAAVEGTEQILQLVESAGRKDVVLSLISGGGSALLVAPAPGVSLQDKQALAQCVAASGGDIRQLNSIRRCLSRVKGGGLARASRSGRLISLVISDVLGDPLDLIASGPTVTDPPADAQKALGVLSDLKLIGDPRLQAVVAYLQTMNSKGLTKNVVPMKPTQDQLASSPCTIVPHHDAAFVPVSQIENIILGNNADAVDAAGVKAVQLGYRYVMQSARQPEGDVTDVARVGLQALHQLHQQPEIDCWISGGEPTVVLPSDGGGKGGRNQQLVLSLLESVLSSRDSLISGDSEWAFMSAGTDGEDGPTPAAGAWISSQSLNAVHGNQSDIADYLRRADAFHYFQQHSGLLVTGPTGTNVCDLRIAIRGRHSHK
jgi:glycerate 2-kinase